MDGGVKVAFKPIIVRLTRLSAPAALEAPWYRPHESSGQPVKSCTDPSKLGGGPGRINEWLKTRRELQ
jgi:hypothetical protein